MEVTAASNTTLVETTLVETTLVETTLVETTLVEPTLVETTLVEPTLITIDVKHLNSIVRSIVSEIVSGAVTDIRKGYAPIVERIGELSNAVMSLKNSLIATNQGLNDLKIAGGKRSAVVYVNKKDEPTDLFGNA